MFNELTDARQKGKVTYSMKTICVTRLFALLCDLVTFNYKHCIVKKHSDGTYTYEHNRRIRDFYINSESKQDCEMNAFKIMAIRIKKNFPKLKFIITADAMKVDYLFIQFAHTIRQLFDLGAKVIESMQGKIKETSFNILNQIISTQINLVESISFQLRFNFII